VCAAGLTNIGLLDTTAGDAEIAGPTAALLANDERHIAVQMTAAMITTAATEMLIKAMSLRLSVEQEHAAIQ